MSCKILLLVALAVLMGCDLTKEKTQDTDIRYAKYELESHHDSLHVIRLVTHDDTSCWSLPYKVFQFVQGDINGDGVEECLVGVVKPTRFHPVYAKRLFIFKNFDGYIRPMWLGSVMPKPLIDFWLVTNEYGYYNIITFEREESGKMLIAEYCWRGFGIDFINYHAREIQFR
jgi:hypothetical protein